MSISHFMRVQLKKMPLVYGFLKKMKQKNYALMASFKTNIVYHGIRLSMPSNHFILRVIPSQPYRDSGLKIAATIIFGKHPSSIYVDVGANVGDTAAVVRSANSCSMILIEASDIYFDYLTQNAKALGPNVKLMKGFFVSPSDVDTKFGLVHWGGTAQQERLLTGAPSKNITLFDISGQIGLLKIDTDGYDDNLLNSYAPTLARRDVNIYFEVLIRSRGDLQRWEECLKLLLDMGYVGFLFWDDPGHLICSTNSVQVVKQLLGWLASHTIGPARGSQRISVFDVLAVCKADADILAEIASSCASLTTPLQTEPRAELV